MDVKQKGLWVGRWGQQLLAPVQYQQLARAQSRLHPGLGSQLVGNKARTGQQQRTAPPNTMGNKPSRSNRSLGSAGAKAVRPPASAALDEPQSKNDGGLAKEEGLHTPGTQATASARTRMVAASFMAPLLAQGRCLHGAGTGEREDTGDVGRLHPLLIHKVLCPECAAGFSGLFSNWCMRFLPEPSLRRPLYTGNKWC